MGLFDKKKHDLELHLVLDRGMIQRENDLIYRFNKYCEIYHYDSQAYKEGLAVELLNEALWFRFERMARIENMKLDLVQKEKEWIGKADIYSYNDFFYIKNSEDPMTFKLNNNRSVYLEGYVFDITYYRERNLYYFKLSPYPCKTDQEYNDVLSFSERIHIDTIRDVLKEIQRGDFVCITGKITKIKSDDGDFIGLKLTHIELPKKQFSKEIEEKTVCQEFLENLENNDISHDINLKDKISTPGIETVVIDGFLDPKKNKNRFERIINKKSPPCANRMRISGIGIPL